MRRLILILAIAITIIAGYTTLRLHRDRGDFDWSNTYANPLARYWPAPDFTLTERNEKPVTLADLKGKVWIADFFYTSCPGPCPMLSSRLSDLQKELANDADVRLVSISSDPEKDTPQVLREYASHFGAGDRWLFLTGSKESIYKLANEGFKLGLAEDRTAKEPISHSTKLVLIDRAGIIRGFYDGVGGSITRLLTDIRTLEKEKP
jgi:protein SCO1/2